MDVFVARQPIFDTEKNVFAYELLFRSGVENMYDTRFSGDDATSKIMTNSVLVIGLETLTQGKRAFINFTRNLLLKDAPDVIPKDLIGVEVLETVEPDDIVLDKCARLREKGYLIVLDDFVFQEKFRPLMELADVIKVDFQAVLGRERRELFEKCSNGRVRFLAEKVETEQEFHEALELGCSYFQGYFFSRPVVVSGKDIPGNKLNYLQVLREVNRKDIDFSSMERIIKRDVSLSYKLLRFVNSAFFRFSVKIESIRHALVMLGIAEIKKWVSLLALAGIGYDKPQELLMLSLVRARFCENISHRIGRKEQSDDYFLTGLFSVIDALVDRPMDQVLSGLPISEEVKQALTGKENKLFETFNIITAYERADWDRISHFAARLDIEEAELPDIFYQSVEWANEAI